MAYVAMYAPHHNSGHYACGLGLTKEEAAANRTAHNNQQPLTTVAFSRAPKWARKEAIKEFYAPCLGCGKTHPVSNRSTVCVDQDGSPLPITQQWGVIFPEMDGEFVSAQDDNGQRALDELRAAGYPTSA